MIWYLGSNLALELRFTVFFIGIKAIGVACEHKGGLQEIKEPAHSGLRWIFAPCSRLSICSLCFEYANILEHSIRKSNGSYRELKAYSGCLRHPGVKYGSKRPGIKPITYPMTYLRTSICFLWEIHVVRATAGNPWLPAQYLGSEG